MTGLDTALSRDYTIDPEYRSLLRAVLEQPWDDLPRLKYADWIEDRGDAERAEFIRVQIEEAKIPIVECNSIELGCFVHGGAVMGHDRRCRGYTLREVADKLINSAWFSGRPGVTEVFSRGFVSSIECMYWQFMGRHCWECEEQERVGDTSALRGSTCSRCNNTRFVTGLVDTIFRRHPVTEVVLFDRRPWRTPSASSWFAQEIEENPVHVGGDLFRMLDGNFNRDMSRCGYRTNESANLALSRACVGLGRERAGLKPLEGL